MADPFQNAQPELDSPASRHFAVVPSDTVAMAIRPRAICCLTAGNLILVDESDTSITYALTAGQWLPIRAKRVHATGTTGTYAGWY